MDEENVIIEIENAILNGVIINDNMELDLDSIKNTARKVIQIIKNRRYLNIGIAPNSKIINLATHHLSNDIVDTEHGIAPNSKIVNLATHHLSNDIVDTEHGLLKELNKLNLNSISITRINDDFLKAVFESKPTSTYKSKKKKYNKPSRPFKK